ncbi:hypothetical protein Ciccas_012574 [Cichlidogyrus casuarinus]|uniref:DUF4590 domain-containing protein n=1 Tax=Cichlidogyrus casuarinus TaxID=1844966 RepID=A0ABD2PNQ3_9PLAT
MLDYNSFKDPSMSTYFSRERIKKVLEQKGLIGKDGSIVPDNLLKYKEQRDQRRMRLLNTIARHLVEDAVEKEYLQTQKSYNKLVHDQLITKHRKDKSAIPEYEPLEHYKDPQNKVSNLILWDPEEMEKLVKKMMAGKEEVSLGKGLKTYPLAPFPTLDPDIRTRAKRPDTCRTRNCPVYPSAYARRPENTIIAQAVQKKCATRLVKSARTSREWHTDLDYLLKPQSPLLHSRVKRRSRKMPNVVMDLTPRFAYLNSHGKRIALVRMKYLGVAQDEKVLVDPKLTRRSTVNELNPHVRTIEVKQQINGGNDLTAFRGRLVPGAEFSFISRRSIEERFSLTIYVDGTHNVRVNTCCEFKHSIGSKLGGSAGNFVILAVKGPNSCFKCKASEKLKELRQKSLQQQQQQPNQQQQQQQQYTDDFEKVEGTSSESCQV